MFPGIRYKLPVSAVVIDAAEDLVWLGAATTAGSRSSIGILGFDLCQDASETSEQLPVNLFRTVTDNSAAGSALTPATIFPGDPAIRGTARVGPMTAATVTALWARVSQNTLNGWKWFATDINDILWIVGDTTTPQFARAAIGFPTAPAAALNISGYVDIVELRW